MNNWLGSTEASTNMLPIADRGELANCRHEHVHRLAI
jgi:hypothetical protein